MENERERILRGDELLFTKERLEESLFLRQLKAECDEIEAALQAQPEEVRKGFETWWERNCRKDLPGYTKEKQREAMLLFLWMNYDKLFGTDEDEEE